MDEEWIFTFGFGHEVQGFPASCKYVRLWGTAEETRQQMFRWFGRRWAFQYANDEEAGVSQFGLKELILP